MSSSTMFVLPEFRDQRWCDRIRTSMDRGRRSAAEVVDGDYRVDVEARRASEVEMEDEALADVDATVRSACAQVARFFSLPLSHNEGPSLLRYDPGGFCGPHAARLRLASRRWPRRISVVLFLTTAVDGDGGTLPVYSGGRAIAPLDI